MLLEGIKMTNLNFKPFLENRFVLVRFVVSMLMLPLNAVVKLGKREGAFGAGGVFPSYFPP